MGSSNKDRHYSESGVTIFQAKDGQWIWRCEECCWVGLDCGSEAFAEQESSRHICDVAAPVMVEVVDYENFPEDHGLPIRRNSMPHLPRSTR